MGNTLFAAKNYTDFRNYSGEDVNPLSSNRHILHYFALVLCFTHFISQSMCLRVWYTLRHFLAIFRIFYLWLYTILQRSALAFRFQALLPLPLFFHANTLVYIRDSMEFISAFDIPLYKCAELTPKAYTLSIASIIEVLFYFWKLKYNILL